MQAVADPSVLVTDYTVSFSASDMSVPQNQLCVMNLNQIYTVDGLFLPGGGAIQIALNQSLTMRRICIWPFMAFPAGKETDNEGEKFAKTI